MNCNCVNLIDEKLAEENLALDTVFILGPPFETTLAISTHWKDAEKKPRGKKPKTIIVSYCPFCGKKTERKQKAA